MLSKTIGYLLEEGGGFGKEVARQVFKTHRSFTAHVTDLSGKTLLSFHRPMFLINSEISAKDPDTDTILGCLIDCLQAVTISR